MAQTKPKAKSRSTKSRSGAKGSNGSKAKAKAATTKAKAATKSRAKSQRKPQQASSNGASASNGSGGIGEAASRAKVPLVAGGAALIGAAGGIAYGATHPGRKVMGVKMPGSRRVSLKSSHLRKAAKDVGHFGDQMGRLAKELRRTREESDGSIGAPVEILVRSLMRRK